MLLISLGMSWVRINGLRSLGLWCIKATHESTLNRNSLVASMHHDLSDWQYSNIDAKQIIPNDHILVCVHIILPLLFNRSVSAPCVDLDDCDCQELRYMFQSARETAIWVYVRVSNDQWHQNMGLRSGLHPFLLATKGWTWSKSIIVIRKIVIFPYLPLRFSFFKKTYHWTGSNQCFQYWAVFTFIVSSDLQM